MERRKFLGGAAALGAAAALTACDGGNGETAGPAKGPAVVTRKRTLKMVTAWPKNFPGLGMSAERLARRITELTDGALTVKVFAAGELVGAFEAFDAVSSGTADCYHVADYYQQGKSKAFPFFTSVPFGMLADELYSWMKFDGGQALYDELCGKFNIRAHLAASTGSQMGGWYKRPINSLEDFKGLKVRMPGLGGEVLRRLGAATVALPGSEIFLSLQSGAIDGAEWIGPWNDLAFGMHKVADHYYYPGFHEPGAALALGFNLDVWNSFTENQKNLIQQLCDAEYMYSWAEYKVRNAEAQKTLAEQHGITPRAFPEEVVRELKRVSAEVLAEVAEEDDITRRVYQSMMAAKSKYQAYEETAEHAFIDARRLDSRPACE
ncbi:MAG: TRAP transporter substrate-binding protein [Alphaproteobacteria bacterium]|nr:MAG: TRAP transporter substrate-binding protein [Alphaproteobacteria bacterium]